MTRIQSKFRELKKDGRKAFIPYITAGDPDLDVTAGLVLALADNGADIIELGIPFSDPMADGPVIQRASERALLKGTGIRDSLEVVRRVRRTSEVPILLFSYLNPLLSIGFDSIGHELSGAGVDGVLVTDLVPEEAGPFVARMKESGLDTVFLVAPTSTDERIRLIANTSTGFVYAVSRTGVTGVRETLSGAASDLASRVRAITDLPVALGFGISTPEQVASAWESADGAVVGSRIVAEIESCGRTGADAVASVAKLTRWLTSSRQGFGASIPDEGAASGG